MMRDFRPEPDAPTAPSLRDLERRLEIAFEALARDLAGCRRPETSRAAIPIEFRRTETMDRGSDQT